jgi:hypothetical protein
MILLDKPLVSDFLMNTVRDGHIHALDTGMVVQQPVPGLLSEAEAISRYKNDPSINLHTTSENALKWIYDKLAFSGLPEKIGQFKNKAAFRRLLADMYPAFFFREVAADRLDDIDPSLLPMPFIIKPSVGFFSMGVHKVFDALGWEAVKEKIRAELEEIRSVYPEEVLSLGSFIIEECIGGSEYAFDAYYDDHGQAVIMGVMYHPFSGENDVSDRVYNTSRTIVGEKLGIFDHFLRELGRRARLKNFSLHVEVRIDDGGKLLPIEVNPLRFGAWCTSADLTHHAFRFNPYTYYINKLKPDWEEILKASGNHVYSIVILENSTGIKAKDIVAFDYDKAVRALGNTEVLELRKINFSEYPIFGILFTRTAPGDQANIERILQADMKDFLVSK